MPKLISKYLDYILNIRSRIQNSWFSQFFLLLEKNSQQNISWDKTIFEFLLFSVQFSHSVRSDSLRSHGPQHIRPPCPSPTPEVYSNSCPLSQWCHPTIQLSHPLSSPSPPVFNPSQHQGLFKWVSSSHQVAKILEFQLQHQSFQGTPRTDLL